MLLIRANSSPLFASASGPPSSRIGRDAEALARTSAEAPTTAEALVLVGRGCAAEAAAFKGTVDELGCATADVGVLDAAMAGAAIASSAVASPPPVCALPGDGATAAPAFASPGFFAVCMLGKAARPSSAVGCSRGPEAVPLARPTEAPCLAMLGPLVIEPAGKGATDAWSMIGKSAANFGMAAVGESASIAAKPRTAATCLAAFEPTVSGTAGADACSMHSGSAAIFATAAVGEPASIAAKSFDGFLPGMSLRNVPGPTFSAG